MGIGSNVPNGGRPEHLTGGIENLTVEGLRARWLTTFGSEPPRLRTRELLALAFAYRVQERAHGGLSGAAKRRLGEFQRRFERNREYTPQLSASLKVGSSVIKAWRGRRHEVIVLERGFSYLGERYGSLSEVAQRITGTKWNGYVFFGLRARSK